VDLPHGQEIDAFGTLISIGHHDAVDLGVPKSSGNPNKKKWKGGKTCLASKFWRPCKGMDQQM